MVVCFRPVSACRISIYRSHTPLCRDLGRCRAWRDLHRCQADRARLDRCRCPRHRLGRGRHDRIRQNIGHAMFITAGMLWACYVVALRKARLDGLHAAAIAAVGSLIAYVPGYVIIFGTGLFDAPWRDLAQAVRAGLLVAVISFDVSDARSASLARPTGRRSRPWLRDNDPGIPMRRMGSDERLDRDASDFGWCLHCKWSPAAGPTERTCFA